MMMRSKVSQPSESFKKFIEGNNFDDERDWRRVRYNIVDRFEEKKNKKKKYSLQLHLLQIYFFLSNQILLNVLLSRRMSTKLAVCVSISTCACVCLFPVVVVVVYFFSFFFVR